jgi:hypothetical protein
MDADIMPGAQALVRELQRARRRFERGTRQPLGPLARAYLAKAVNALAGANIVTVTPPHLEPRPR